MLKRPVKALLLALVAVLVVATPVLAYVHRAQFAVSNNSTTAYEMLPIIGDVNNGWMSANGFMNTSANDTRIETLAGTARPHMVTDTTTLTAIVSPAFSQTNLYYTTGQSELASFYIITGYSANSTVGYITATDHGDTEPGSNWSLVVNGWLDTDNGTNKYIAEKPDRAFRLFVSDTVSENVTCEIGVVGSSSETLRPDGNSTCALPNEAGAACPNHYQNVDEAVVSDADWVGIILAIADGTDIYTLANTALTTETITSVDIIIRGQQAAGDGAFRGGLTIGGDTTWGAWRNPGAAWTTYTDTDVARPGGGTWVVADLNGLLIDVNVLTDSGDDSTWVSWTYIVVNYETYTAGATTTATGVTTGEHCVECSGNTTDMMLYIDTVLQDTDTITAGAQDTGDNWTYFQSNVMPYCDNLTYAVGGTQVLRYNPSAIIVNDLLPDSAPGTAQDGTIIWGANPADLTVIIRSMVSSGQPSLGADIDQPTQDILPDVEVSDWFVDPDVGVGGALLTNPIRPFVTLLSDNSTLTERQVWILYGLAFVLFVTVGTSVVVRGHHGITGIMCAASMIGLVALTVWPLWTVVFIIGAVVIGLVSERSPSL